jgi:tetratricopeptide (TPR) repeat protein
MTTGAPPRRNRGGSSAEVAARIQRFRARPFVGFRDEPKSDTREAPALKERLRRDLNDYGCWHADIQSDATVLEFPRGNVRNGSGSASEPVERPEAEAEAESELSGAATATKEPATPAQGSHDPASSSQEPSRRGLLAHTTALLTIVGVIGTLIGASATLSISINHWSGEPVLVQARECLSPTIVSRFYIATGLYRCPGAFAILAESESAAREGAYEKALDGLSLAMQISPSVRAYVLRGRVHAALGHAEETKADFAAAVRLEPRNYETHFEAGTAYYLLSARARQGSRDLLIRARESFQLAVEIESRSAEASHSRGLVLVALGDDRSAEIDFLKARSHSDSRYAAPRMSLAMIYYRRSDFARARAALEEVLSVSPVHSEALRAWKLVNARSLPLAKARKLRKVPPPQDDGDTPFNFFKLPALQDCTQGVSQVQS